MHKPSLALALWLAGTAPALAQAPVSEEVEAQARLLYDNGERLYDEGHYEEAILAFQEAYALSRRPALLFNVANAYERLGKLQAAIDALNGFRVYAPADQQEVLAARVRSLEARLVEQQEAERAEAERKRVEQELLSEELVDLEPPPPPPVPRRPRRPSPAPWVVATTGALLAVGGGAVAGGTWATSRQVLADEDPERWAQLRPVNNLGFGVALVGGAVGVSGLAWGLGRP